MRRVFLAAALLVLASLPAAAQQRPDPALSPRQVVAIQLEALQANDTPTPDAGIERSWAFAHPKNREATGPLPRFKKMLKGPHFKYLLNHRRHRIEARKRGDRTAVFAVTIVGPQGKGLRYRWQVAKAKQGPNAGAWLTLAVSPPQPAGQGV